MCHHNIDLLHDTYGVVEGDSLLVRWIPFLIEIPMCLIRWILLLVQIVWNVSYTLLRFLFLLGFK
jgi:hypothetical protein